jgi:hypothetical protein
MNPLYFNQALVTIFDTSFPTESFTISHFPYLYSAFVSNVPTANYEAYLLDIHK